MDSKNFVRLLRNGSLFDNHDSALSGLQTKLGTLADGEVAIASYGSDWATAKSILGVVRVKDNKRSYTIYDNEASSQEIATEIAKLNADKSGTSTDGHVTVNVVEADGIITSVSVTTSDIASAQALADEVTRATEKEADLLEKINKNTSDIASLATEVGEIELKKEGDLSYALYVNGTKHGDLTIPKDQFLKSATYDSTTKELVFVFVTTDGEVTTRVSVADLVDTYTAGDGLTLSNGEFSVDYTKVASVQALADEVTRATTAEEANAQAIEDLETEVISNEKVTAESLIKIANANGIVGSDGIIGYQKKTDANYIKNATSVHDATVILDAQLKTVADSVNTLGGEALKKVNGSNAISVSEKDANKEQTVSLKLDGATDNALQITANGLYVSNVWDCGEY